MLAVRSRHLTPDVGTWNARFASGGRSCVSGLGLAADPLADGGGR